MVGTCTVDERLWRVTLHRNVEGAPGSVEADWTWALEREETQGDVMGFLHTHPADGGISPSARDVRTMQAWCSALGKPMLCLIAEAGSTGLPGGTVFSDDESEGTAVQWVRRAGEDGFVVSW